MDFFKEWMKTLLSMIIGISIPTLLFLITFLLVEYLGFIGIGIVLILLFSLLITVALKASELPDTAGTGNL